MSPGRTGRPVSRPPSATPRARSAAARASGAPAKRGRTKKPGGTLPRGGARGGFQWTALEAAAMLSVTFAAFVVKEVVTASEVVRALPGGLVTPVRVGVLILYYAVQLAVLLWLVRRRGGEPASALGLSRPPAGPLRIATSAGLVFVGLVVTRLLASAYAYLTRVLGLMPAEGVDLPALFGTDAAGVVLAVAMVVVVGPVVEEVVFRGALLEGLNARVGPRLAIVVQAALFAAFHRSLWLLFPTFVLGVALGWLAHERESLWPPIALHGLYNAITVVAAFVTVRAV